MNPPSLSFGDVIVGRSASLTGSLRAAGATVKIASVTSTSGEFVVSGVTFPASLDSGHNLPFTVTFTPQTSGAAAGSLSFTSDADNSPVLQSENGTGQSPPQHRVALSWTPSKSAGVVGYNVYRGTTGSYSRINDVLEAATSYGDEEVIAGTTYYYVVTAVDDSGVESIYSESTVASIPSP